MWGGISLGTFLGADAAALRLRRGLGVQRRRAARRPRADQLGAGTRAAGPERGRRRAPSCRGRWCCRGSRSRSPRPGTPGSPRSSCCTCGRAASTRASSCSAASAPSTPRTRLFIGHLPDKLGPRRVATWSGIGEAAGLVIIAVAPNLLVAVARQPGDGGRLLAAAPVARADGDEPHRPDAAGRRARRLHLVLGPRARRVGPGDRRGRERLRLPGGLRRRRDRRDRGGNDGGGHPAAAHRTATAET